MRSSARSSSAASARSSIADEVQSPFRHVLVRDVAYGQLPRARRAESHLRAAAWLESLSGAEELAEQLAYHYTCASSCGARSARRRPTSRRRRSRLSTRQASGRSA